MNPQTPDSPRRAFTLIELLVVVTIIAVLLALLTPALDAAIYQAELTVCGANQKGIINGVSAYALQYNRHYPYRIGVTEHRVQGYMLADGRAKWDDRSLLKKVVPLDMFNDPLTGDLELDPQDTDPRSLVFSSYDLWFGFQYKPVQQKDLLTTVDGPFGEGMFKLGDRFSWQDSRFAYLTSDRDVIHFSDGFAHNSHPDAAGILRNNVRQDQFQQGNILDETFGDPYTKARWDGGAATPVRGMVDLNFGSADGAVVRLTGLAVRDPRQLPVPEYASGKDYIPVGWAIYLAKP